MNFKTLAASVAIAAVGLVATEAGFASTAEARVVRGNVAGFQGVTAIDRGTYGTDTLYIPFSGQDGQVDVSCSTGDYSWNSAMGQASARAVAVAWCGY
jgi:hypothetical protein